MKTTWHSAGLLVVVVALLAGGLAYGVPASAAARGDPLVAVHSYRSGQSVSMAVEAAEVSSWGLSFSTRVGGEGTEYGMGMASDPAGNGYVVGFTAATDFPGAGGTGTDRDVVVLGFSPDGTPRYVTRIGGAADENGYGIRHFADGSVVIVGHTASADFPVPGAVQPTKSGGFDGFVARLDPDGALAWATFLGGGSYEALSGVSVDPAGNIVAVGQTSSAALAVQNPIQATYQGGGRDVLVAGLTPDGSELRFLTYLGGSGTDAAFADWALADGSVVLGGMTGSADFPTTAAAVQPAYHGGNDTFIVKITPAGQLAWSTYLGGNAEDRINGVGADAQGRPCVAGKTMSPDYPTVSAVQPVKKAGFDEYVTCLDTAGSSIRWSTFLGSSGADYAGGIAVEPTGGVWIAGGAYQGDFPLVGATQQIWGGAADATVSRFSDTGAADVLHVLGRGGCRRRLLDRDRLRGRRLDVRQGRSSPDPVRCRAGNASDGFDLAHALHHRRIGPAADTAAPTVAVAVPTKDQVFPARPVGLSGHRDRRRRGRSGRGGDPRPGDQPVAAGRRHLRLVDHPAPRRRGPIRSRSRQHRLVLLLRPRPRRAVRRAGPRLGRRGQRLQPAVAPVRDRHNGPAAG